MYGDFVNATTGRVTDGAGRTYDLDVLKNNSDAKRTYRGVTASASFRLALVQVGANYTLSWSRGNVDGEGATPSFRTMIGTYPEYRQASWNSPLGYTMNDQRQKSRAWVSYDVPVGEHFGRVNVGVMQRFDSALPYDVSGHVDSRPYVSNAPRYITPPSSVTYYFSPRFGLRWDSAWNTDIAVNWSKKIAQPRTELFFRGVITNVFNNSAVFSGDSTILTNASPGSAQGLQRFNPFTDTPVWGVNWTYGPGFGQPSGPSSYQTPRTFSCSAGVRF